jgi:translocation and assembly module TamB
VYAAKPIGLSVQSRVQWQPQGQAAWDLSTRFDGSLEQLALTVATAAPFHAQVSGQLHQPTHEWRFEGDAQTQDLDPAAFGAGLALGKLDTLLHLVVDAQGIRAKGRAESAKLGWGIFNVDFNGSYADRTLTLRDSSLQHQTSRALATASGSIAFPQGQPLRLALSGQWQNLRLPFNSAKPAVLSAAGRYRLSGQRPYATEVEGDFTAAGLPLMRTQATGLLDTDRFTLQQGALEAYGGHSQLRGSVQWSAPQSLQLTGTVRDLDTGKLLGEIPGHIGFDFAASLQGLSAGSDLDLRLDNLRGTLHNSKAQGSGHIGRKNGEWLFDALDLKVAQAHLTAEGTWGQQPDLRFSVIADDLALLSPQARGHLTARGSLGGTLQQPVLRLRAQGADFVIGKQTLRSLDADINLDLQDGGDLKARLQLRNLLAGGRRIDSVLAEVDGNTYDNSGFIAVDAAGLQLNMAARGSLQQGRWQGLVRQLTLGDGGSLQLALATPSKLTVAAHELTLESTCLNGRTTERLCGAVALNGPDLLAQLDAQMLPLRTLTAGLTANVDYEGTIALRASAQRSGDTPLTASLQAGLSDAQLRHTFRNGREERFALGSGVIDARLGTEDFELTVGLDAGKAGNIAGKLHGQRVGEDWAQMPIDGDFSMQTDGLGLVALYAANVDRSTGRLSTHARIGGTLGEPDLQGDLQLRDVELDVYRVNFALRKLNLDARLAGDKLEFEGSAKAGEGSASLSGQIAWRERKPYGKLHLEGSDLAIVNIPEARVHASPKVDFQIAGQSIDITGEVRLPYGVLEPATITNAVLASSDEVLVSADAAARAQVWQVTSDINVVLGDKVSIDTLGLKGRLAGSLRVQTDAAQNSRGSGELGVAEGRYAAFGRNLDVARGRLLFNNGPLNDPGIDLRAQKVFPDVTAGVNVRGTLRAPRMTFFSEPAISQSQIVSLILAGGSLDSVQNSSRSGAARNDLLAQGGAILAQQLGSRVGIEDVGIESNISNDTCV